MANIMNYLKELEEVIADIIDEERFSAAPDRLIGAVQRRVETFLLGEFRAGKLKGRTPGQAFFVHCVDPEESVPEFEIGVALHKPVQFFKININQF